ncbi:MAG: hypothetical protein IKQ54_07865 [Oscillospiraceae bacterium]|nr:hypothetical protein [Oscillospiraceae bacterium]
MKHRFTLRRGAAILLTAVMTLGCFWPSLTAKAVDYSIDDSGFKNPQIDHGYIYHWKKGIPPVNSSTRMKKYPVLLTWDGKYYFRVTADLASDAEAVMANWTSMKKHLWVTDKKWNCIINGSYSSANGFPHMACRKDILYSSALLSDGDFAGLDFETLKSTGKGISVGIPDGVPYLIPYEEANTGMEYIHRQAMALKSPFWGNKQSSEFAKAPIYGLGVKLSDNWFWGESHSAENEEHYTDGGFRLGENYIVGVRKDWYEPRRDETGKLIYSNGFNWMLYGLNNRSMELLDRDLTVDADARGDDNYLESYGPKQGDREAQVVWMERTGWFVINKTVDGQKKYAFMTVGLQSRTKASNNLQHDISDWSQLTNFIDEFKIRPWIALSHSQSDLETRGCWCPWKVEQIFAYKQNNSFWNNKNEGKAYDLQYGAYAFDCWYGEPELMDYLQTDFTVQSGQVTNLDGPIAITNGTTITVEDGGVLAVDGWVINNGTIKVEEGGTLWIQDGACVNRFNDRGHVGGGIISNGLVIVGENAKLIGGGVDGIQLLNGSHAVNYGCIASENFFVEKPYTIENQDKGFVLYGEGNSVTGVGVTTFQTALNYNGKTFAERGKVEEVCYTNLDPGAEGYVPNAIFSN